MSREEIGPHEHDPIKVLEVAHLCLPQQIRALRDVEVGIQFPFLWEGDLKEHQNSFHHRGCGSTQPLLAF